MEKRIKILLVLCGFALAIGISIGWLDSQATLNANVKQKSSASIPIAGVKIGGPYALIDQDGKAVTDQDFKDSYKLIYFGFTYCPAICPTELQKITAVLSQLPAEITAKIQPVFITIDPERDTADLLKDYVSLFHDRLIGLTGTIQQVEAIKKTYRVFARKAQDETLNDYTMDHSSYIYFMSPDDQLLGMYRIKDSVEYMLNDIHQLIY